MFEAGKPKRWRGNRPSIRSGWTLANFVNQGGEEWEVYTLPARDGSGWLNIKLVACGLVPVKANYWIAWFQVEERFADSDDFVKLQTQRPELFRHVQKMVGDRDA